MSTSELDRVAELAGRLAERTLADLEGGGLTTEEFRESADLALILNAAKLLLSQSVAQKTLCETTRWVDR
jgi:hypothetical protein